MHEVRSSAVDVASRCLEEVVSDGERIYVCRRSHSVGVCRKPKCLRKSCSFSTAGPKLPFDDFERLGLERNVDCMVSPVMN